MRNEIVDIETSTQFSIKIDLCLFEKNFENDDIETIQKRFIVK